MSRWSPRFIWRRSSPATAYRVVHPDVGHEPAAIVLVGCRIGQDHVNLILGPPILYYPGTHGRVSAAGR